MRYIVIVLLTFAVVIFFSCSKNNFSEINPSPISIQFEGEGGHKDIVLGDGNWKISKVINQVNNQNIFGNIYALDGNLMQENEILKLDNFGSLESAWSDKGFIINQETASSVTLQLKENFTKDNFNFEVVLESGNISRTILISQKPSQGYKIGSIKFTVENDNSDSIFVQQGRTYDFNINSTTTPHTFSFDPFVNTFELSRFTSNLYGAFPWKETDSVMIETPFYIIDNKIFFNNATSPYTTKLVKKNSRFAGKMENVLVQTGSSKFIVELEYRKRKVSYTLHLINKRTDKSKVITGKWTEIAPTGHYEIKWQ